MNKYWLVKERLEGWHQTSVLVVPVSYIKTNPEYEAWLELDEGDSTLEPDEFIFGGPNDQDVDEVVDGPGITLDVTDSEPLDLHPGDVVVMSLSLAKSAR